MINSRLIKDLILKAQLKYWEFDNEMRNANLSYLVTSTLRDAEFQNMLYEQGRTKPGKIVTWTRDSKHKSGTAFDIVIINEKTPSWSVKVDVNKNMEPDYEEAAKIGRKVGLKCGADFKDKAGKSRPDWTHFELKD